MRMNHQQLKEQLGESVTDEVSYMAVDQSAVLTKGDRLVVITLNPMDLYDVFFREGSQRPVVTFRDIYADKISEIISEFFHISLKSAIDAGDDERVKEIEEKAKNGEVVRIL